MATRKYNPYKELPIDDPTLERLQKDFTNTMKETQGLKRKKNPKKLWKSMIMVEIRNIREY